jgi:hypothetical protein
MERSKTAAGSGGRLLFLIRGNSSGVVAVAVVDFNASSERASGRIAVAAVEVVGIMIHVVVIVVVRRLIEESGARTVVGAMTTRTDVVDPGVARQIAAGLIAPRPAVFAAAAKARGIAEAADGRRPSSTDAAEQQRAADHAGRGRRRGSEKRAAAAAHRRLRRAIGLAVGRPDHIVRDLGPAASPGRCSRPGGCQSRAGARSAPSRASRALPEDRVAHRIEEPAGLMLFGLAAAPVPGCGHWRASAPRPAAATVCTSA